MSAPTHMLDGGVTVEQQETHLVLRSAYTGQAVVLSRLAWNQVAGGGEHGIFPPGGPVFEPVPADQPPEELPH